MILQRAGYHCLYPCWDCGLFFEHPRGWLAHVEDFHGWEVTEMNSDCEDMDSELESDMESDMEIEESEDDMEF